MNTTPKLPAVGSITLDDLNDIVIERPNLLAHFAGRYVAGKFEGEAIRSFSYMRRGVEDSFDEGYPAGECDTAAILAIDGRRLESIVHEGGVYWTATGSCRVDVTAWDLALIVEFMLSVGDDEYPESLIRAAA